MLQKGTRGISWEDELCIKAFWWFCKADLVAILEQNGSHALAPVFKQTEGEGGGGVAGGRWKLFVGTCFLHV